jgi:hypothetical protein
MNQNVPTKPNKHRVSKTKSNKRFQEQANKLLRKAAKIAVDRDLKELIVPVRLVSAASIQTTRLENVAGQPTKCHEKSSKNNYYEIYWKYSDGTQIPTGETSPTKPDCDAC